MVQYSFPTLHAAWVSYSPPMTGSPSFLVTLHLHGWRVHLLSTIYCSTHDPHCAWCPITVAHLSLHCTWCLKYCGLIYVSISCGVPLETAAGFQFENIHLFRSVRLWRYIVRICHRAATDGLNRGFVTIPARADNYKFGVCTPACVEAVKLNQTRQAASRSDCRVFHCMNQKEVGLMCVCAQASVGHALVQYGW